MANPVADLLELARQLWDYERRYQMPSAQFYANYQAGVLACFRHRTNDRAGNLSN